MAQKSFFLNHSDNENEVILYLGITSILQHEFNIDAELFINTTSDLTSLINRFHWKKIPGVGTREKNGNEISLENANIPAHLLKVQHSSFEVIVSQAWTIAEFIFRNPSAGKPSFKMTYVHSGPSSDWISLNEANDALIAHWYRYRNEERELTLLEVKPGGNQDEWKKAALQTDLFIINKISPITAQFIKLVRTLNPSVKMIFHAFEAPSVYFAGTYLYGLNQFLYEEDLWLMSCEADLELAKKTFENIKALVLPLRIPDSFIKSEVQSKLQDLYYVGRISEQKNIHEVMMAVWLIRDELRKNNRKLKVIGYEDFLGLPNLRIPSVGYLEFLYRFANLLGINDLVEFHPAIPQGQIVSVLSNGVFISTSVHSDENFGLVAYRALNAGIPVILSKWGGHKDFSKYFSNVHFVNITSSAKVPHANPYEIAEKILKVWSDKKPCKTGYSPSRISLSLSEPKNPLRPSGLKIEIEKRLKNSFPWTIRKWPLYGKIFASFTDKKYRLAMTVYGAEERAKAKPSDYAVSPLVKFSDKQITVADCSTGKLKYSRKGQSRNIPLIQLGNDETVYVSLPEWDWLWENGVVYRKGDL